MSNMNNNNNINRMNHHHTSMVLQGVTNVYLTEERSVFFSTPHLRTSKNETKVTKQKNRMITARLIPEVDL